LPVVGFLNSQSARDHERQLAAFIGGLAEAGYVDGRNVKIEYRWAESHPERLPSMMVDLIEKKVTVIAATSTPAALAAKAANTTIPVVFETGFDPIQLGLVTNLSKPGENITGVTQLNALVTPKRLELLHELVPKANVVGLLVNPANPTLVETETNGAMSAAKSFGITLHVLNASDEAGFEGVFAKLTEIGAGGLVVGADPLFTSRSARLGELAARHAMPAIFENRSFAAAGGLASYGGNIIDSYRLTGAYVARILKGEKPGDLPVQQGTKLELFINASAAKTLGIVVPLPLSGRADEVIE
jgi:putative ABC transport system substrate-binding protein